jgi:predicted N-acetyltransferase YhbS
MSSIRKAATEDLEQARDFYLATGYSSQLNPSDVIFFAEEDVHLVGIVRLCNEGGVTVLRGMRVVPARQRCGIGTELLLATVRQLQNASCYCVPYSHLIAFYERGGFGEVPAAGAPGFLGQRLKEYRIKGLDVTLMGRLTDQRVGV